MQNSLERCKMKWILKIAFSLFIFTATGCVTLYKPNVVHSPLLKEKGEVTASASLGISGSGLYNFQAATALSDHAGIMADGMYHTRMTNHTDSSYEKLNLLFAEAGGGYFTRFSENKKGLFQCYGGGGFGSSRDIMHSAMPPEPEVSSKYMNVFVQPGVAYTDDNFEAAFDVRMNYVQLFNIHAYLYKEFEWWNTDFVYYSDTTLRFVNIEPAVTVKAGGEKLKGILQFGVTIPAVNSKSYFMTSSSSLLLFPLIKFSVGISYRFGKKQDIGFHQ